AGANRTRCCASRGSPAKSHPREVSMRCAPRRRLRSPRLHAHVAQAPQDSYRARAERLVPASTTRTSPVTVARRPAPERRAHPGRRRRPQIPTPTSDRSLLAPGGAALPELIEGGFESGRELIRGAGAPVVQEIDRRLNAEHVLMNRHHIQAVLAKRLQ